MLSKKYWSMPSGLTIRGAFLFFLLSSRILAAAGEDIPDKDNRVRFLGLQYGTFSSPLGEDDPFAFPLGAGLFFEAHPEAGGARFFWGGSALYYRFRSRDADFNDSFMVQAGLSAGFDVPCAIDGEPVAAFTPYFGVKEYYREYRFRGELISGHRGVAVAGARLSLMVAGVLLIGFDLEYNLLLEQDPLNVWACYQRLGVGF